MVKSTTFNSFATTATRGSSIEGVHNSIHGLIGMSGGHMGFLSYSAFDPIL
jgi:tyrosinase